MAGYLHAVLLWYTGISFFWYWWDLCITCIYNIHADVGIVQTDYIIDT